MTIKLPAERKDWRPRQVSCDISVCEWRRFTKFIRKVVEGSLQRIRYNPLYDSRPNPLQCPSLSTRSECYKNPYKVLHLKKFINTVEFITSREIIWEKSPENGFQMTLKDKYFGKRFWNIKNP